MDMFRVSILCFSLLLGLVSMVFAQVGLPEDDFYIIPEATWKPKQAIDHVKKVMECTNEGGVYTPVWECYNKELQTIESEGGNVLWYQLATGIISWKWVLFYIAYLIRFLAQMGMVIGAAMIIYTGYKYAISALKGEAAPGLSNLLVNILLWLFLITASYGILKLITTTFL